MIGLIHYIPTGSSNIDLSGVTATASDVLEGKVIVDANGNPLTGTMANIGAVEQSLSINGAYNIPQGYHDGSGKVTQNISTMSGQTLSPKTSSQTVSCSSKYMTGNVVLNAPSTMAGQTITPKSSAQTVSCSGKYMTGNIVVNGVDIAKYVTGSTTAKHDGGTSSTHCAWNPNATNQYGTDYWTLSLSGFKSLYRVFWTVNFVKDSKWYTTNSGSTVTYNSKSATATTSTVADMTYSNTYLKLPATSVTSSNTSTYTYTVYYYILGYAS